MMMKYYLRPFFLSLVIMISASFLSASASGVKRQVIGDDIHYEYIGYWSKDRLNQILKQDFPKFSGIDVNYSEAKHGVKLYRLHYASVVPEQANRPIRATGLVAIPDGAVTRKSPLLSYQHGTVYGKDEVPSQPEKSPETQLMLAQFAGQGYIVIGADYFGMGQSDEPEGYMVKASHQQASVDMLKASRALLASLKIDQHALFLSGWSQGGFVTMAMLERLEQMGETVTATATASAPLDLSAMLHGIFNYPRPIDAAWLNSIIILSAFSFERYYNAPGLARSVINDAYYDIALKAYLREAVNFADIPTDLHQLVRKDYFNPRFLDSSPYGQLMAHSSVYRWVYQTPVRNYYGEADEAISIGVGQLAMNYQHALGSGNQQVTALSTGKTTHRGTYAVAANDWKSWFDSYMKP